jgi:hypothetical protein
LREKLGVVDKLDILKGQGDTWVRGKAAGGGWQRCWGRLAGQRQRLRV